MLQTQLRIQTVTIIFNSFTYYIACGACLTVSVILYTLYNFWGSTFFFLKDLSSFCKLSLKFLLEEVLFGFFFYWCKGIYSLWIARTIANIYDISFNIEELRIGSVINSSHSSYWQIVSWYCFRNYIKKFFYRYGVI